MRGVCACVRASDHSISPLCPQIRLCSCSEGGRPQRSGVEPNLLLPYQISTDRQLLFWEGANSGTGRKQTGQGQA